MAVVRLGLTTRLAWGAWLLFASSAAPCTIRGPLLTATELVNRADVIVVAVARELVPRPAPPVQKSAPSSLPPLPPSLFQPLTPSPPPPPYPDPSRSDRIRFEVKETLKGEPVTKVLIVGHLTDRDDFNDTAEPVNEIRPAGHAGCYAESYRLGAAYLLLLKKTPDRGLSPYWTPLSRLNDQIRPGADRWLEWVRRRVAERRGGRG